MADEKKTEDEKPSDDRKDRFNWVEGDEIGIEVEKAPENK